ncbi:hypothetical protein Vadar_030358 [Vaccinium darrowii]|uniref:Uncharacterized protein n=1 Tax=Vaccinium darrowii TaxID=229202 RepID=A0ACB7YSR6_9ERIC|nr:hypothetical protein Vadar_030358 [Vaccinium darrowii]
MVSKAYGALVMGTIAVSSGADKTFLQKPKRRGRNLYSSLYCKEPTLLALVVVFGRLAGATLIAPVVNYWLPGFPRTLAKEAYNEQLPQDQWAVRIAHYTPWLTYWWNTQKWFPASSVISKKSKLSPQDVKILTTMHARQVRPKANVTQQGEYESFHRELMVGFWSWEFDPMELDNPFPDNEGSVHLWQGDDDWLGPVTLQRHIAGRLPWICYHEVTDAGHFFPYADGMREAIFKTLLLGEKLLKK